ncbi:MAG: hypothetical protein HXY34_11755 [Candidatus Thorarchaeota archaeon]|nr:hypothetical protein [Candidatus Thorarchaeota archaeon]
MNKTLLCLMILMMFQPATAVAAGMQYSGVLQPGPFGTPVISWTVLEAPDVPFELFFSGSGKWLAAKNSMMVFQVTEIGEDVNGTLTLGNATWKGKDTDIAKDLTLSIWGLTPWLPGLVVPVGNESFALLNQTAYQAASRVAGNYMNGTVQSSFKEVTATGHAYLCMVLEYEQDAPAFGKAQKTRLAYDTVTGILVEGSTFYSFGQDYNLTIELQSVTYAGGLLLPIVAGVTVAAILAVVIIWTRRR